MALIAPVEDGKLLDNTRTEKKEEEKSNDLGYDQFLQLLCAEMQYQDPLEPTSNTEYVAQLATFSQMEATLNMQSSLESMGANSLVGQYVIVKSDTASGGLEAGFVDYVQYENGEQYLYINGHSYSASDIYQVADVDYMEAVTLAEAFAASIAKMPDAEKLTVDDLEKLQNIVTVYNSLTSYQQSYIDADTLKKFQELVAQMEILKPTEPTEPTE